MNPQTSELKPLPATPTRSVTISLRHYQKLAAYQSANLPPTRPTLTTSKSEQRGNSHSHLVIKDCRKSTVLYHQPTSSNSFLTYPATKLPSSSNSAVAI